MPAKSSKVVAPSQPSVRVFTLGRFQVEVNGAPLRFGRKAPRKPLDLLKLLVARGGAGVTAEQLAEDLWPDAEGDAAAAALRTTLSRLRRLVGPATVLGDIRGYAINPQVCWIDALAIERVLAPCDGITSAELAKAPQDPLDEVLALYRGGFLPGELSYAAVVRARARLQRRVLRCLGDAGRREERAGHLDRAMRVYRRALEIDDGAEDMARDLMRCCRLTGRRAEGIGVYRRCEAALRARFGVAPSGATQDALQALLVRPPSESASAGVSIAVQPFRDLSPQGGQQRLADKIRETVVSLLGALPQLSLVMSDVANSRNAAEAAFELPEPTVRYLLRGSVLASRRRLRARVELVDARTGLHAWSEELDQELDDVIQAQDRIAVEVAEGVTRKLVRGHCVDLLLSPDIHAWKALTQIRVLLDRQTRTDHLRARALIGRLLEREPRDPSLLSLRAGSDVIAAWKCWTPNPAEVLRCSEMKLRHLQRKYGGKTYAPYILPYACTLRGEFSEALRIARKHIDQVPENFFSHAFFGTALLYQGRDAEAVMRLEDAISVRPEPLHWLFKDRAVAHFRMGRYDEAICGLAKVLVDDYALHRHANLRSARLMYVGSLAAAGRTAQASHEARLALAADPGVSARAWSRWHFQWYRDDATAHRLERLLVSAGVPL